MPGLLMHGTLRLCCSSSPSGHAMLDTCLLWRSSRHAQMACAQLHTPEPSEPCRKGFPAALRILDDTIANMTSLLPGSELDINNASLRVAMDITGEATAPS